MSLPFGASRFSNHIALPAVGFAAGICAVGAEVLLRTRLRSVSLLQAYLSILPFSLVTGLFVVFIFTRAHRWATALVYFNGAVVVLRTASIALIEGLRLRDLVILLLAAAQYLAALALPED